MLWSPFTLAIIRVEGNCLVNVAGSEVRLGGLIGDLRVAARALIVAPVHHRSLISVCAGVIEIVVVVFSFGTTRC